MTNVHAGYGRSVACLWLLVALTAGALCVPRLRAQAPKAGNTAQGQKLGGAANPVTPCCNITGIDETGRVAAKDNTTGKTFQFQVNDSALLTSLHVGQSVSADFGTNRVAVAGINPCCNITSAAATSQAGVTNTAGTSGSGSSGSSGVIQSQDANAPGLVAELTEATRAEGILTVKVRFRNTSKQRVDLTLTKNYECEKYYVVWENNKQTVLKDSKGEYAMPVREGCNDTAVTIAPGQAWVWWGKFAAPPAMVTKIELYTPIAPPFEDIPITNK